MYLNVATLIVFYKQWNIGQKSKYTHFNKKFGDVILELFNERLECKSKIDNDKYSKEEQEGADCLQRIYKLMLNSSDVHIDSSNSK